MDRGEARRIPIRFIGSQEDESADYPARPPQPKPTSSEDIGGSDAPELTATIRDLGRELLEEPTTAPSHPEREHLDVERLKEEKNALYDRLIRLAAEFENYRKRVEREREQMREEILAEVLAHFLPIVDDFERALEGAKWLRDVEGVLRGLDLIHRQLLAFLAQFDVHPIETLGRPFDPTRHEAWAVEPTDQYEENTILDEYRRGYIMGDRVLRPARVKVAVRPNSSHET